MHYNITYIKNLIIGVAFVAAILCGCTTISPKIVAHGGGKADFPENIIYAFKQALDAGSSMIETDVQLTKDNIVVLYHPSDVSSSTEASGSVNAFTYLQLSQLDAAYHYAPDKNFPERGKGHKIPSLAEALSTFPSTVFIIDFKALPANTLVDNVVKVINQQNAWERTLFYSTNAEHLDYLRHIKPDAQLFENRNTTRKRLLELRNGGTCCCDDHMSAYVGFELDREMTVEESFALGKENHKIHFKLFDKNTIECIKKAKGKDTKIFLFGINTLSDFEEAKKLHAYAVFSDSPLTLMHQKK